MRWNLIEQMQCGFEIFLENKHYIIDHVGTLLVALGLALDMMLFWQSALWSSLFRCINKIAHCNCHTSPFTERKYFFLCHGKVTHLTQQ